VPRRVLLHHLPLAIASSIVLALFMGVRLFDARAFPHPDLMTAAFPQVRGSDDTAGHVNPGRHGANGMQSHGTQAAPMRHGHTAPPERSETGQHRSMQQLTVATGYLALGLLAVTLLLGPANLVLGRRNPISTYLRRDVGIWTAFFSIVHIVCAVLVHTGPGRGLVSAFLHFFVANDGSLLTNSFGWGNWTGLAALVIALGLLATSNDIALRTLKARPWKWLQRLNYALFLLVILHAFFYGAFLRLTSPFTLLLLLSAIAVFAGQSVGIWLWRRKHLGNGRSGTFHFVTVQKQSSNVRR